MPNLKKNLQRNTSWAGSVAGVTPGALGQPSLAHTGLAPPQPAAGTQPPPVAQGPPPGCMHPDAIPPTTRPCAELPPKVKELLEELAKANLFYLTWTRTRQWVRCEKATPFQSRELLQIDFIRGKSEEEPDSLVHLWQHRLVADEKGIIKEADIDRHPRSHLSEREQRTQKQDALEWLAAIRNLPLLKDLWASLLKDNPGLEERLDAQLAAMQAEVTKWESFVRDPSRKGGWQFLGQILVCEGPEVGPRPQPELLQRQIHAAISSDTALICKRPDRLRPVCQFPQRIGFGHDLPKSLQDKPDQVLQDQTQVAALKRLGSELGQVVDQADKAKKPVRIVLRGYTDGSGAEAYNLKLSDWRADWVEHQLRTAYGIPETVDIDKLGCGERYAASQAPDPEARLVVVDVEDV
jgi:hypothetical protein